MESNHIIGEIWRWTVHILAYDYHSVIYCIPIFHSNGYLAYIHVILTSLFACEATSNAY